MFPFRNNASPDSSQGQKAFFCTVDHFKPDPGSMQNCRTKFRTIDRITHRTRGNRPERQKSGIELQRGGKTDQGIHGSLPGFC